MSMKRLTNSRSSRKAAAGLPPKYRISAHSTRA